MKILLIKFRNIGDVLLSSPLVENLKYHFPDAQIDFALNKECETMMTFNPYIREVFIYNRAKIKSLNFLFRLLKELQFISSISSNNYDIVINLTEGDRGALLALVCRAKTKLSFRIRKGIFSKFSIFNAQGDDTSPQHTVEKDLQFIKLLGKSIVTKKVSIYWPSSIEKEVDAILDKNNINKFVHIHPVSRWMFKCWEDDKMANIVDFIQNDKGIPVVITGANNPQEIDRINKIISLCKTKPINLSGKLNLKQLACLSSKANLFFGVDTAPMHIAAATNTPVVSLLGASEALKWGPWNNNIDERVPYINTNGIQYNGRHTIFSDMNHTIFFEQGIKKCKGMINIKTQPVKQILNKKL